jgi:hypothetical protein
VKINFFQRLSNDKKINLVPTNRNRNSTILLHAMDKTVSMDDVGADTVMPSLYGLDLRINKYNNGVRKAQILKREMIYIGFFFFR